MNLIAGFFAFFYLVTGVTLPRDYVSDIGELYQLTASQSKAKQVELFLQHVRKIQQFDLLRSIEYADEALKIAKESNDPSLIAEAAYYSGQAHLMNLEFLRARTDYIEGHAAAQQANNYTFKAYCEFGLAAVAYETDDLHEWELMVRQAYRTASANLQIDQQYGRITEGIPGSLFSNLAAYFKDLGEIDKAERITLALIPVAKGMKEDLNFYPWNLLVLGEIRVLQNRGTEAESLFQQALEIYRELDNPYGTIITQLSLGKLFYSANKYSLAQEATKTAQDISRKHGFLEKLLESQILLAKIYTETRQFEKAVETYTQISDLQAERYTKNLEFRREAEEVSAELVRKENELLKKLSNAQQQELDKNILLLSVFAGVMTVLILLALIIMRVSFQRKVARNQLKASLDELQQVNHELKVFNYSVSHDLRSPANNILGFVDMLEDNCGKGDVDSAVDTISRIKGNAQRMLTLIENLLQLSRTSSEEIHLETIDLGQLAQKVVVRFQRHNTTREINLESISDLHCVVDPGLMEVMLENLVDNSLKYSDHAKPLNLRLSSNGEAEHKIFRFEDNGYGFEQELADSIFEPFVRLHDKLSVKGSGIGLATVKRVIERHNGRIWAESAPDKGTRFFFTFGPVSYN